ncbi:hypothetical protein L3Y34_011849 [Caenorhabditis briggsae]|uniref:SET domain-containing protein n=1 Tax=Caenorhabditis briggsae TaxID=6238 RepID=A0AAE8ZXC1_CAEBR|nr:hypothetical protein L3Y34_011849 [Caenorhabditis briggsae]
MNPNVRQVKETAKRQLNVKIGINDLTILHLDDYIREALLDPIYGFSTSKWFLRKNRLPNNCKEEIKKLIKTHIFEEGGSVIRKAICTILSLYEDDERLSVLVENYMQLFYAKSGFTAAPCHQFSTEQHVGLKLIATKKWEKDEILNSHNFNVLFDTIPLELNEYSVSKPSVGQKEHIWLGPSSIVNHSCEPNTVYEHYEKKTLLKVIRPIEIGEEITVNYSKKYFFKCECDTCKKKPEESTVKRKRGDSTITSKNLIMRKTRASNTRLSQEDSDKELAKTYALYKKLFDSVDYPPELKESAGSAEHSFTQRFLMIETPQIDQHLRTFAKQTKDMVHRVQVSRNLLSKDEVNENLTRNCWKNAEKLIQIGTVFMTGPEKLEANDVDDLKSMAKKTEEKELIRRKEQVREHFLGYEEAETNPPQDRVANLVMQRVISQMSSQFRPIITRIFDGPTQQTAISNGETSRKRKSADRRRRRTAKREKSPTGIPEISDVFLRVHYTNRPIQTLHVKEIGDNGQQNGKSINSQNQQKLEEVVNFFLNNPTITQ